MAARELSKTLYDAAFEKVRERKSAVLFHMRFLFSMLKKHKMHKVKVSNGMGFRKNTVMKS